MSELRTITVPATDVQVGDLLHGRFRVLAVDAKVKWVYVTVDGRKTAWEIGRDSDVEVGRVMLTDAEQAEADAAEAAAKAIRLLEAKLMWLDMKERSASSALRQAQERMAKAALDSMAVGYSEIGDLLEAQATYACWARVARASQIAARNAVEFDAETGTWTVADLTTVNGRLEGFELVKGEMQEDLRYYRASSQSTSVVSNACDAVAFDAKVAFLSRW